MVPRPDELRLRVTEENRFEPHQRRTGEIEAGAALLIAQFRQARRPHLRRDAAPIEQFQRDAHALADHLQRLRQTVPGEGGAQHAVAAQHFVPRPLESGGIERSVQARRKLLHVHVAGRRGDAVEQHPLLHR